MFDLALYALAIKKIRIENGGENHHKHKGEEKPAAADEAGECHQQTADNPKEAGEPMGFVPVCLAVQRPGQFDADGVALLALRQIIADDHKQYTDQNRCDGRNVKILVPCGRKNHAENHQRQQGDDPKDEALHLAGMVFIFGVCCGDQNA